jgi:hypothetical protein
VQSIIPEPDDEDKKLYEVLELLRRQAEFQRRAGFHGVRTVEIVVFHVFLFHLPIFDKNQPVSDTNPLEIVTPVF